MTQIDQQNVPKLRFPGFDGDWGQTPLAKLVTSHNSGVYKKKELYGSGTNIIGVSNFYSVDSVDGQSFSNVPLTEAEISQFGLQEGDILYTESSLVREGIAKALFVTNSGEGTAFAWHTRRYKVDRNRVFPAFLYFELSSQSTRKFITSVATQTALTGITTKDYFRTPIHLPTLPEQRKIAGFLGAVDLRIAQLAKKKRLLEDYKKGCMQQLFSQKIRFKDDTGNDFPDWEEKRLGEVFGWINTNSLSRERLTYNGGQVQNIHYGDIHTKFAANFRQDAEPVPYIKDATPADFKTEQFCKVGDVVIADASEDYSDIGKAIEIVSLSDTPMVAGLHTYIARPKPATVQTGFAGYLLRSAPMRRQVQRIAQGISVLGISKRNLEKLTFFLPHPEEQRKIADFLSALDRKIDLVDQELTHARSFKQGLLQQMFV